MLSKSKLPWDFGFICGKCPQTFDALYYKRQIQVQCQIFAKQVGQDWYLDKNLTLSIELSLASQYINFRSLDLTRGKRQSQVNLGLFSNHVRWSKKVRSQKQIGEEETNETKEKYTCRNGMYPGQVSAWQSATLLPISCKSVQPVPARVEEPGSPVRQSSTGGATNNPPFPNLP